jgi:phage terminase large subunit-like protein
VTSEMIEVAQVAKPPDMDRVVVAVDPVVSSSANADECGIVVVGAVTKGAPQDWRAFVLADCTVAGLGPSGWAKAAIAAMEQFGADRLVAEVNQGGQLVAEVIRQIDPLVPYKAVPCVKGEGRAGRACGGTVRAGPCFTRDWKTGRAGGSDDPHDSAWVRGGWIAGPCGCAGVGIA